MAYVGNTPFTAAFLTDTFSGNGSTVAFTMSVAPATTSSVIVAITGVLQSPDTYSVSGTTLTFSAAPPTGTSNISVRYLGIPASGVTTTAYRTQTEFTATAGQTTFSVPSYTVGFIDVYRNGLLLGSPDFTATNGTTVVLTNAASAGDFVETVSFYVSSVLNALPNTGGTLSGNLVVNGDETISGNVGIGTASPAYKLDVAQTSGDAVARVFANATTTSSRVEITNGNGTTALNYSYLRFINSKTSSQDWRIGTYGDDNLSFVNVTAGTVPMTINTSGVLTVGTSAAPTTNPHTIINNGNGSTITNFLNYGNSTPYGIYVSFQSAAPNNNTQYFYYAIDNAATRFVVKANGGINNYTANNVNLSDKREKTNFAPAGNYLAKICAIPVQTFNYIDQNMEEDDGLTLGVVAQDVAAVAPELVIESNWGTEEEPKMRLGIYQTDLQYALMKCIQEQQAIITQLQADVAALKGNP